MFLSFIVPVYNVETYLEDCLKSLLIQNIPEQDYEIICVNDGSTDGSATIMERYAATHKNLRIYRQQNAGVSAARNCGLELAQGDYVWFVDADDLIAMNVLAMLKQLALEGDYDRIAFDYYYFKERFTPEEQAAYDAGTLVGFSRYKDANVVTGILRRQLIEEHQIRFVDSCYGEDNVFIFEFLTHVAKQTELDRALYYYRQRPGSTSNTANDAANEKRYRAGRTNVRILRAYLEGEHGEIPNRQHCADLFMSTLWSTIWQITMMPRNRARQELRELKQEGLFPRKRQPECTLKKSYLMSRTDLYGRLFDFLYIRQATRPGYLAVRGMNRLRHTLQHK